MEEIIGKIAFKTIPRLGVLSLVLLSVSFCFLFSAGDSFLIIQKEKNMPYELKAIASDNHIESDQLLKIEGVEGVSPVVYVDAELECGGHLLDTEVTAVYSSFPRFHFTQGVIYPDNSNMPYLVLNEAASKSFSLENNQIAVKVNDTVNLHVNGETYAAIICGIFYDDSESPSAYMSYDTARRLWGQESDPQVLLSLSHLGAVPKVVQSLRRYQLTAVYDSGSNMAWDLLRRQAIQSILCGLLMAVCAAAMMMDRIRAQWRQQKAETAVLRMSGLTSRETDQINPVRVCFAECSCFILAILIAVCAGIFSFFSFGLCLIEGTVIGFYLTLHNSYI